MDYWPTENREETWSLSPPRQDRARRQLSARELFPGTKSAGTLTLFFPASRTLRRKLFSFKPCSLRHFTKAAQAKTVPHPGSSVLCFVLLAFHLTLSYRAQLFLLKYGSTCLFYRDLSKPFQPQNVQNYGDLSPQTCISSATIHPDAQTINSYLFLFLCPHPPNTQPMSPPLQMSRMCSLSPCHGCPLVKVTLAWTIWTKASIPSLHFRFGNI